MRALLIALLCCAAGAQSLFVNAGGPATIGDPSNPQSFQADQFFSSSVAWVDPAMGAGVWSTLRYAPQFSYDFQISNGFYTVKLDLLEPNKTGPGQRIFTVTANGVQSDPIDIFATTGAINTQTSITLLAMVGNGHLRLNFQATLGNAVVSAIEVTPSMIFAGIQTVNVRFFTCAPPLSDTTCNQVPAAPAAMQWFKCTGSPQCAGIEAMRIKLADGTVYLRVAEPLNQWITWDQKQWSYVLQ